MHTFFDHKSLDRRNIVRGLTLYRLANYPRAIEISLETLAFVKTLTLEIGNRILEVMLTEPLKQEEAKSNFSDSLNILFIGTRKNEALKFSAQLFQYYTMLKYQEVLVSLDSAGFIEFLDRHIKTLGASDINLFVIEYKLIKIYNDIIYLQDTLKPFDDPSSIFLSKKTSLLTTLIELGKTLKSLLIDEENNIFHHYLYFCVCYCNAKAIELEYHVKPELLSDTEKHSFFVTQQIFLEQAYRSIQIIEKIQIETDSPETYTDGKIFTLGRHIFDRLPSNNIEAIKTHLLSLRKI